MLLGLAQTVALPGRTRDAGAWARAMPLLWALGWTVTTLGGIPVAAQFTIFGASGAVTFSALSGLLLHGCCPRCDHRNRHRTRSPAAHEES